MRRANTGELRSHAFANLGSRFCSQSLIATAMFHSEGGAGDRLVAPSLQIPAKAYRAAAIGNHFRGSPVSFRGDEDEGDHRHENRISRRDCDSCSCRWYWAGSQFCQLAVFRTAVDAGCRSIGVSCVRGTVRASVRWLGPAQLKTQTALPRPWDVARSAERPARRQSAHVDPRNAAMPLPVSHGSSLVSAW